MKVCPVCGTEYGDESAFCSLDRSPLRPTEPGSGQGLVGELIGERYQVERRLGEGGMGEVYLARHVLMGRASALKVMNRSLSRDPDAVSRFNREATNASRISHPNVCAVYDFGLTPDGLVYLAMEYVEGETLSALLKRAGPLSIQRAAELVSECARGLQAAHDMGIVHRDLKPDNIMVVSGKDRDTVKLVDFGIAKATAAESGQQVTRTGFIVGTPEYMSPEQLAGDPVEAATDQYALALVLYRAITGQLPFAATSAQETLAQRLTAPPLPLAAARPGANFPAGLQEVMDRALARRPGDRYPRITAFADAVVEAASGDSVPTRRIEPALPPTRQAQRARSWRRRGVLIAAGAVIAVGGGTWLLLAPPGAPPSPAPVPPSTPAAADTQSSRAEAERPAPAPPAAAPLANRPGGDSGIAAPPDTAVPEPEQFDDPVRRQLAIRRAQRIMNSEAQPRARRAFAAASLGYAALTFRKDRTAALAFYRWADSLNPGNPNYAKMIRQLQDSVPR